MAYCGMKKIAPSRPLERLGAFLGARLRGKKIPACLGLVLGWLEVTLIPRFSHCFTPKSFVKSGRPLEGFARLRDKPAFCC